MLSSKIVVTHIVVELGFVSKKKSIVLEQNRVFELSLVSLIYQVGTL